MLGRTGTLSLTINKRHPENIVIRLGSESWETILTNYVKYFDSIYGEKYVAFQKLAEIRHLTSKNFSTVSRSYSNCNDSLSDLNLAVHIVYDLSLDGRNRKLSLSEQLSLFNIIPRKMVLPVYTDNLSTPSILFIIGFIIGDGTLFLRLRNSDKGSIWLIPTLTLPQLKNKYNAHFFSILKKFFNSLNIKTYINNNNKELELLNPYIFNDETVLSKDKNKTEMSVLTVESLDSVFYKLLPLISPYSHFLFWKIDQYKLMSIVAKLVKAKTHYTLYGFINIIEIIYSYPHNRHQPKKFWIKIIQCWFKSRAAKTLSGENNIQAVHGRGLLKGQIVAWKCIFPVESKINSRQFGFSIDKNFESSLPLKEASYRETDHVGREALNQAIQFRDVSIKNWVDSLK